MYCSVAYEYKFFIDFFVYIVSLSKSHSHVYYIEVNKCKYFQNFIINIVSRIVSSNLKMEQQLCLCFLGGKMPSST